MQINFAQVMKNLRGEDINQPEPLTLAEVCAQALLGNYEDDKNTSAESKISRFRLAHKLFAKNEEGKNVAVGDTEITIDEAQMIKKFVNKAYGVLIVGQVDEIIR